MNITTLSRSILADALASYKFHEAVPLDELAVWCDRELGPGAFNEFAREIRHGVRRVTVPDFPDALNLALAFCRLDGWDDDPSRALGALVPDAHTRFLALLLALKIGAPTR